MRGLSPLPGARLAAGLLLALVAILYFHRADELPRPHGDERAFLDVPFRFANFGDLRYPVFMSESFGAADLRPYPPITALALRSLAVKATGFSARNSRLVSGVLVLAVVLAAAWWLRSNGDLSPPLLALAMAPIALAPVVILAARSTRLEQETFFFGACSALLLASGGRLGLTRSTAALAAAGGLAAIAAGMHPFGVVYGGLGAMALVAARRPKDLMIWISGAAVGALPTLWWMAQKGRSLIEFAGANGAMYQAREKDLTAWLAQFSSVAWLTPLGLPESVLARLASVQHGAFSDYIGFPMEPGGWSLALRTLFWVEAACVARFLFNHVRARKPEHDGVALLALIGLGFLVFTFSYVPNTTYGLYGGFHIHLAFAAVGLAETARLRMTRPILALVGLVYAGFGLGSAGRLIQAPKTPTLDEELSAIAQMARSTGISSGDTVMTSTETWVAAGPRNTSLLERIQYGLGSGAHDALVYRRSYVSFYLGAGLPTDPSLRRAAIRTREAAMAEARQGLTLAGLLILDHAQKDAVYFFRRATSDTVSVASIDPARSFPLRTALRDAAGSGPRVECDNEALPLCTFHER